MLEAKYFYDNSHGWIVIQEDHVILIGLNADDFSRFSYCRVLNGQMYYALEEDADASRLIRRLRDRNITIKIPEQMDGATSGIRWWNSIDMLHTYSDTYYSGKQRPMVAAQ